MTPVQLLRAARARYAASPSHASPLELPEPGTYCAVTALSLEGDRSGTYCAGVEALKREAGLVCGRDNLVRWNYRASTEEVLAAFDRAIQNEEAREQEHTASPVSTVPDALPV